MNSWTEMFLMWEWMARAVIATLVPIIVFIALVVGLTAGVIWLATQ